MGQVIGYVRGPAASEQDSAQAQRLRLGVWARETGHTLTTIIEETNPPVGGVGPAFGEAVSQLKAGDVLVLDTLAVAATALNDWANLYQYLHRTGVAIASVSEGFDTLPGNPGSAQVSQALLAVSAMSHPTDAPAATSPAKQEQGTGDHYLSVYTEASALAQSGDADRAINVWRAYLQHAQGENAACGWNCVGDIQTRQHRTEDATTSFMNAALAFEQDGDPDRALAILAKVRRNAPKYTDAFIHQARLSAQLERMGDALSAYLAYARTQTDAGNYQEALDSFDKIRLLNPVDPRFRLGMAAEMSTLGFHEEAVKEIICAAELLIEQNDLQSAHMELSRIQGSHNKDVKRLLARIDQAEAEQTADHQPALISTNNQPDFLTPSPDIYHPAQFKL